MKLKNLASIALLLITSFPLFANWTFDRAPLTEIIPGLLWSGNNLLPGDPRLSKNDYYDLSKIDLYPELPSSCDELVATDIYNTDYTTAPLVSTEWARLASIQGACWSAMRYDQSAIPEKNFLGKTPLSNQNMRELWDWAALMNEAHSTDDYTKFLPFPHFSTYECVTKEECYSFDDREEMGVPGNLKDLLQKDWVAYYDLWAITDINHDGFADAIFSSYDRVHGRLKPSQHVVITRKGPEQALEVLEIFPTWSENYQGIVLPTKFY